MGVIDMLKIAIFNKQLLLFFCLFFIFWCYPLKVNSEELPAKLQVALMSKIFAMESKLAKQKNISIFVLNAPRIYELLVADIGFKMGNSILLKVDKGNDIPTNKYDIIYIGSFNKESLAINYTAKNKVMSLYPVIKGMKNYGSLGLGIKSGKPLFLLNLHQSQAENLNWNPTILRVARISKVGME